MTRLWNLEQVPIGDALFARCVLEEHFRIPKQRVAAAARQRFVSDMFMSGSEAHDRLKERAQSTVDFDVIEKRHAD